MKTDDSATRPYEITMPHPEPGMVPQYNSTRPALRLPEYGRLVQDMVAHALTLSHRAARQRYAEAIIGVMATLTPQFKGEADYRHKLWNHLAYLADYKLDIDYPYEIKRHDDAETPRPHLSYPKHSIRFRHYGAIIEEALDQLAHTTEGPARDRLTRLIAARMKRNLADWKGDGIDDSKVARDIAYYTDGAVEPDFSQPGKALPKISDNRFRARNNKKRND